MLSYCGHESGGVMVLTVEQSEPGAGVTSHREWLYKTVESREDPRFVVDLAELHHMTSSDVGLLLTLKARIDARKGKLVLTRVDPYIVGTLRSMNIERLFTITPDLPAALAALSA
jgi:anti-sigma B factor antagonist